MKSFAISLCLCLGPPSCNHQDSSEADGYFSRYFVIAKIACTVKAVSLVQLVLFRIWSFNKYLYRNCRFWAVGSIVQGVIYMGLGNLILHSEVQSTQTL